MTLQSLYEDMKQAMKDRNEVRLGTLRMLIAEVKKGAIDAQHDRAEVSEDELVKTVSKQIKQRRDAIEAYTKAGRSELADKEQAELEVLMAYMPQQLSRDEIREIVVKTKNDMQIESSAQMGQLIGGVMKQVKGRADGSVVQEVVREVLA